MNWREIYELWLNSSQLTEDEKKELKLLSEEEMEELFRNEKPNFGTGGIREKVGLGTTRLNRFTCNSIFKAFSRFLKDQSPQPSAAIFHDNRRDSRDFALLAASILSEDGIEVLLAPEEQLLSTPFLSYTIRKLNLTGGLNITASHNPTDYNGIKIYNKQGKQLLPEEENQIKAYISSVFQPSAINTPNPTLFKTINLELLDEYFEEIVKTTTKGGKNRSFAVLFSSHHGTAGKTMKTLANRLGFVNFIEFEEECRVTPETNPGEIINPEDPNSFKSSIEEAERLNIDYVFSTDPDGDRSAFAERQRDGSWYFFNGNEMGIISSHFKFHNKQFQNPYIVTTYVTGTFMKRLFPNIPIHVVPTGFKNISQAVEEEENKGNNLIIAFEESIGSLLTPIHREKDSFQQTALVLEIISHQKDRNRTLKDYMDSLQKEYGYWRAFTTLHRAPKTKMEELKNYKYPQIKENTYHSNIDLIEWKLSEDNWIRFRYSGTEPKLKAYYNIFGNSKEEIDDICSRFQEIIGNLLTAF